MITLHHSIEVAATPLAVFEWLVGCFQGRKSYQVWHPDHGELRWINGEPMTEGAVADAEEYLHGVLHKFKFRIVTVIPNRRIEYRPLFPLNLIGPGNTFEIEPLDARRSRFTAAGRPRMPRRFFERIGKRHEHKIEETIRHMAEEGRTLKKALEIGAESSSRNEI